MTTNYIFQELDNKLQEYWDTFVLSHPLGTIYHTSKWQALVNASMQNCTMKIFVVLDGSQICGGFSLLEKNYGLITTAVTPLFTPYTGLLISANNHELKQFLLKKLNNYYYVNLVESPRQFTDPYPPFSYENRKTYIINLLQKSEEIWNSFYPGVRQNIRKADKFFFEYSANLNSEEASEIIKKTIPLGRSFPKELVKNILDYSDLNLFRKNYAAYNDQGKLISFITALHDTRTIYYALAGTRPEYKSSGVHSKLIWQLLAENAGQFQKFDFIGANISSIAQFKSRFSPVEAEYFVLTKNQTLVNLIKQGKKLLKR